MRRFLVFGLLVALLAVAPRPAPQDESAPNPDPAPNPEPGPQTARQPEPAPPSPQVLVAWPPEPNSELEIPTVEQVRSTFPSGPGCGSDRLHGPTPDDIAILCWGTRAFPAYEAMLADPETNPWHVGEVCSAIATVQAERRQFIPLLVRRLADPDALLRVGVTNVWGGEKLNGQGLRFYRKYVRWDAVYLLGHIGDEHVTEFILPFLSDDDASLRYAVLQSLLQIGGKRDLDALDSWLGNPPPMRDRNYYWKVKKCRDELEARLNANPERRKF